MTSRLGCTTAAHQRMGCEPYLRGRGKRRRKAGDQRVPNRAFPGRVFARARWSPRWGCRRDTHRPDVREAAREDFANAAAPGERHVFHRCFAALGPLASPQYDPNLAPALPAALIMTGEYDTLAPEMDRLAQELAAAGVPVTHRRFAQTDHGFTHEPPVATAREAIVLIGEHLRVAFAGVP